MSVPGMISTRLCTISYYSAFKFNYQVFYWKSLHRCSPRIWHIIFNFLFYCCCCCFVVLISGQQWNFGIILGVDSYLLYKEEHGSLTSSLLKIGYNLSIYSRSPEVFPCWEFSRLLFNLFVFLTSYWYVIYI